MILVTGGAGFIGSNFVLDWLSVDEEPLINLDILTYAGNLQNLASVAHDTRHVFVHGDMGDSALVTGLLDLYQPRAVINFAAESHVDRSLSGPADFIQTNIVCTFNLLECVRTWFGSLPAAEQAAFRFLQISTDEVYGSLGKDDAPFTEQHRYQPNSPYSASKAAADHLVRAYHHSYGLPVLTIHCANNYGPYQFPEKLLPLCIVKALAGEALPLYGDGQQVRDWLYVKDSCSAIRTVLAQGRVGESYNAGAGNEKTNLALITELCRILDELKPRSDGLSYASQISFVADRPGHDRRYAMDASKLRDALGWRPQDDFAVSLRKTVEWYFANEEWLAAIAAATAARNYESLS